MIRKRVLPEGWYPSTAEGVRRQCERWEAELPAYSPSEAPEFVSAICPHAGWSFSGRIAYATMRRMAGEPHTVVVAGGHLRAGDPLLIAPEEAYETPGGSLRADGELAERLRESTSAVEDTRPDNTVEVQLPLLRHLFPNTQALYLRCPPDETAEEAGRVIARYARETARRVLVVGSTDLTHYGPAYGFRPAGSGAEASRWVREENDRAIVDAMLALDPGRTVQIGNETRAACSAGAAACAMRFAAELGATHGTLVEYGQSYDVRPDTSFVGYVGIGFAL